MPMTLSRTLALIGTALFMTLGPLPAGAGETRLNPVAVLELFTSQGCSSCPPADALLDKLGQRKDVVTLAYHVDYWDYIGWKDIFGAPTWSELQRKYARRWGGAGVYTPQMVVNGMKGIVGSDKAAVDAALSGARLKLPIMLTTKGDMLDITIAGKAGLPDAIVWLVTFRDRSAVDIQRGENAGRTIDYTQIVTGRQVLTMWEPKSGAHFKLPMSQIMTGQSNGAAILVQVEKNGLPGQIIGAAAIQL